MAPAAAPRPGGKAPAGRPGKRPDKARFQAEKTLKFTVFRPKSLTGLGPVSHLSGHASSAKR